MSPAFDSLPFPSARAQALFFEARERPAEARGSWLRKTCGDDADLLASVEGLLACEEASAAIEPAAAGTVASWAAPPALPDVSGLAIGSCRIVRRIAEGGMGRVYEAVQDPPGRRVAVKLLRQALPDDLSRARFEDEARLLAAIDHPGVCRLYEVGTWSVEGGDALPYCVMELVEDAKPVTAFATDRGLSVFERVRLAVDVCAAVSASHNKGVLHRDLKPANVLVDRTGHAKVIDFGIARTLDDVGRAHGRLTRSGMCLGTPAYMSPEQLLGRPEDVDVRADVHALGVILYEMLTGRLPRDFGDGSLGAAVESLRGERPPSPDRVDSRVPRDLAAVVSKAIEGDAARRYSSVAEFGADLSRWLERKPVHARPAGALRATALWVRRHRAVAVLTAVLLLVIAGGTAFAWMAARREAVARDRAETFLRRSREFIPWLLTEHQRSVGGLPRSLPVVRALAAGVRGHLQALSYDEVTDPDLLLVAARSYVLLADVESGVSVDTVDLPKASREDAETGARLARRLEGGSKGAEPFEVETRAELLLARMSSHDGDYAAADEHLAASDRALDGAARHGPSTDAIALRVESAIAHSSLDEIRGEFEKSASDVEPGVRGLPAANDPVVPPRGALHLAYRRARIGIRSGRTSDAAAAVTAMESAAARWEATGQRVDARSTLYRQFVFLADATERPGADGKSLSSSPLPYFERARQALVRWREADPSDRQVDGEEVALSRRTASVLVDAGRFEEAIPALDRADVLCAALLRDDASYPPTWRIHSETTLVRAQVEQSLGHRDAAERLLAKADEIAAHMRTAFPDSEAASLVRCRTSSSRAILDAAQAERESDPTRRRSLLDRALAEFVATAALYRDAPHHGVPPETAQREGAAAEAQIAVLRQQVADSTTR